MNTVLSGGIAPAECAFEVRVHGFRVHRNAMPRNDMWSASGGFDLLYHVEYGAAADHTVLPDPIEILDQRLDRVRFGDRLGGLDRIELVEGDVHAKSIWRIALAPATPSAPRAEDAQRPGQMIRFVPVVELGAVRLRHFGANREIRLRHLPSLSRRPRLVVALA